MAKIQRPPVQTPKAYSGDADVVPPPTSFQVEAVPRVVLYAPDGSPLKRKVGF